MSATPGGAILRKWRTGVSPTSSVISSATRRGATSAVFMNLWQLVGVELTRLRDGERAGQRERHRLRATGEAMQAWKLRPGNRSLMERRELCLSLNTPDDHEIISQNDSSGFGDCRGMRRSRTGHSSQVICGMDTSGRGAKNHAAGAGRCRLSGSAARIRVCRCRDRDLYARGWSQADDQGGAV